MVLWRVEFNMDAAKPFPVTLTSMRTSANKDWASGTNERWDINGRCLLGFDGYQRLDNGNLPDSLYGLWRT